LVEVIGGGDSAPWWGVPVIAGLFILLGGYLSYLWARSNEKRRLDSEHRHVLTTELMEFSAELIALGSKFSTLGERSLVTPLEEFLPELIDESTDLIAQHSIIFNRFRLVMPQSIQKTVVTYSAACVSLTFPPFDEKTMTPRLNHYVQSEQALVNALRRLRGLTDLEIRGDLDSQEKRTAFADRVTDSLIQAMKDNGVGISDRDQTPSS